MQLTHPHTRSRRLPGAIISPRTLGPGPTTDWGRLQRESQGGGPECVWWEPGTPLPPPKGTYRVCAVLTEPQAVGAGSQG